MPDRGPFRSSAHYHARAEECRTMAAAFNNDVTRAKMLVVADDYERMAKTAAALEAADSTPARRED